MLKKALTPKLSLLFVSVLLLQNSVAEDYTQWELPEGAKARLGKGVMWEIQYSPDSARLAVASSIGIWLYDTATDQEVALLTGTQVGSRASAFSPDGRTLASGGSWDDTICLWDAITGAHKSTLTGHTARVNSVAFSPDGRSLASGAGWPDNSIRLWDAVTGEHKRTLTGHTESVRSVAFSPDGKTLASGSWDGTVLLWDIPLQ